MTGYRTLPFYTQRVTVAGCNPVSLLPSDNKLPFRRTLSSSLSESMKRRPILADGIQRFDVQLEQPREGWPSASFENPSLREVTVEREWNIVPDDSVAQISSTLKDNVQLSTVKFPEGTKMYGSGEVGGKLERSGSKTVAWNTDAWGYDASTPSLYQSHPWILALLPDGRSIGVLADTTHRCQIDLTVPGTVLFEAAAVFPVVTFGPFPHPEQVLKALTLGVGRIAMPPKWALGYHQSRFSYEPDTRVQEVALAFRERSIPCDVIWLDIDYMDGYRCFTFHPEKFPDPKALGDWLHGIGLKAVWMIDPGIKVEEEGPVYSSGTQQDVWVLDSHGQPFCGVVWPGECVFPDFTRESSRDWWADIVARFCENGVDGIWNDMNEPSVFNSVTKTMPESNIHRGDTLLGGTQTHSHYHNIYGMLMARATWEGIKRARPDQRPFVLTRAGFIGSHRYAATWTGDNLATWEHLGYSIPMVLNLGLSGQPFSGPDIGGFAGDSSAHLFGRWMGIAALLPFCRGHSETGTRQHEPWSFGPQCEAVCRAALERRYRLLPHIYTLFYHSHSTGVPVATPLFFQDPTDRRLLEEDSSFMLGSLLVSAATSASHTLGPQSTVLLPPGTWNRFHFDDTHPDLPLLFLKGGSILPTAPVVQSTHFMGASLPLILYLSLDGQGKASGVLYEDDGDGYGYLEGDYLLTTYLAARDKGTVRVAVGDSQGTRVRPSRKLIARLLLGEGAFVEACGVDGQELTLSVPQGPHLQALIQASLSAECHQYDRLEPLSTVSGGGGEVDGPLERDNTPIHLTSADWDLRIVPWIGGRIVSMVHLPTGMECLVSREDIGGYEEYSSREYRSAGCKEPYTVHSEGEDGRVWLEGDVGGGVCITRSITARPHSVAIQSSIQAKHVGAGAGGVSRIVCLRVHPSFNLPNPSKASVTFTTIKGDHRVMLPEHGQVELSGEDMPNGEWSLVDESTGVSIVNEFNIDEVASCYLHWGAGYCNLELWSPARPVTRDDSLTVSHSYQVVM